MTPNSIRAVLGVSVDEIEDVTIEDPVYAVLLSEALADLSENLEENYDDTVLIDPKTKQQQRFVDLVSTWSAYQVASSLLTSIKMFAPKTIKSDKDEFDRVTDPYADLRGNVDATLATLGQRILALYIILFPGETPPVAAAKRTLVVNVGLATDPITG